MFQTSPLVRRLAALLALATLVGVAAWLHEDEPPATDDPLTSAPAAGPAPQVAAAGGMDPMSTRFDPARLFDIGFAGGLRIDADTRGRLDQLLVNMPSEPTPADLERLEAALRQGLPTEDAQAAMKLVNSYLAYLADVKKLAAQENNPPNGVDGPEPMLKRMEELQLRHFDAATVQALFGDQMRMGRLVTETAQIEQDASLTGEQKAQKLEALRAQAAIDLQDASGRPAKPAVPH